METASGRLHNALCTVSCPLGSGERTARCPGAPAPIAQSLVAPPSYWAPSYWAARRTGAERVSRLDVGLGRPRTHEHADAGAGNVGARVSRDLALFGQILHEWCREDSDIELLAAFDLALQNANHIVLDHELVARLALNRGPSSFRAGRSATALRTLISAASVVAPHSVCDGGLVIDLSPMRRIRVDPAARTARAQPGAKWIDFDHETQAFGLATTGGTAETEDRARRHEPGATAREDGHEVADAPGEDTRRATAWAWSSNEPVHDQDATKACPERDLAFSG